MSVLRSQTQNRYHKDLGCAYRAKRRWRLHTYASSHAAYHFACIRASDELWDLLQCDELTQIQTQDQRLQSLYYGLVECIHFSENSDSTQRFLQILMDGRRVFDASYCQLKKVVSNPSQKAFLDLLKLDSVWSPSQEFWIIFVCIYFESLQQNPSIPLIESLCEELRALKGSSGNKWELGYMRHASAWEWAVLLNHLLRCHPTAEVCWLYDGMRVNHRQDLINGVYKLAVNASTTDVQIFAEHLTNIFQQPYVNMLSDEQETPVQRCFNWTLVLELWLYIGDENRVMHLITFLQPLIATLNFKARNSILRRIFNLNGAESLLKMPIVQAWFKDLEGYSFAVICPKLLMAFRDGMTKEQLQLILSTKGVCDFGIVQRMWTTQDPVWLLSQLPTDWNGQCIMLELSYFFRTGQWDLNQSIDPFLPHMQLHQQFETRLWEIYAQQTVSLERAKGNLDTFLKQQYPQFDQVDDIHELGAVFTLLEYLMQHLEVGDYSSIVSARDEALNQYDIDDEDFETFQTARIRIYLALEEYEKVDDLWYGLDGLYKLKLLLEYMSRLDELDQTECSFDWQDRLLSVGNADCWYLYLNKLLPLLLFRKQFEFAIDLLTKLRRRTLMCEPVEVPWLDIAKWIDGTEKCEGVLNFTHQVWELINGERSLQKEYAEDWFRRLLKWDSRLCDFEKVVLFKEMILAQHSRSKLQTSLVYILLKWASYRSTVAFRNVWETFNFCDRRLYDLDDIQIDNHPDHTNALVVVLMLTKQTSFMFDLLLNSPGLFDYDEHLTAEEYIRTCVAQEIVWQQRKLERTEPSSGGKSPSVSRKEPVQKRPKWCRDLIRNLSYHRIIGYSLDGYRLAEWVSMIPVYQRYERNPLEKLTVKAMTLRMDVLYVLASCWRTLPLEEKDIFFQDVGNTDIVEFLKEMFRPYSDVDQSLMRCVLWLTHCYGIGDFMAALCKDPWHSPFEIRSLFCNVVYNPLSFVNENSFRQISPNQILVDLLLVDWIFSQEESFQWLRDEDITAQEYLESLRQYVLSDEGHALIELFLDIEERFLGIEKAWHTLEDFFRVVQLRSLPLVVPENPLDASSKHPGKYGGRPFFIQDQILSKYRVKYSTQKVREMLLEIVPQGSTREGLLKLVFDSVLKKNEINAAWEILQMVQHGETRDMMVLEYSESLSDKGLLKEPTYIQQVLDIIETIESEDWLYRTIMRTMGGYNKYHPSMLKKIVAFLYTRKLGHDFYEITLHPMYGGARSFEDLHRIVLLRPFGIWLKWSLANFVRLCFHHDRVSLLEGYTEV